MACPLCYTPPIAMACSALGLKLDAEKKFGLAGAGGAAMLGVAWLRRNGCAHKTTYLRANLAGGAAMLVYAVGGYAYETQLQARPAEAEECAKTQGAKCDCAASGASHPAAE
jgi:hypothetical protein